MDTLQHEEFYSCPYCGAAISCVLDLSEGAQTYVEDCEVCCCPIELAYDVDGGILTGFRAIRLDD